MSLAETRSSTSVNRRANEASWLGRDGRAMRRRCLPSLVMMYPCSRVASLKGRPEERRSKKEVTQPQRILCQVLGLTDAAPVKPPAESILQERLHPVGPQKMLYLVFQVGFAKKKGEILRHRVKQDRECLCSTAAGHDFHEAALGKQG